MRPSPPCLLFLLCIALLFSHDALAQLGGDQTGSDPFARVQFIHSMVDTGPLDVYLNDTRWLDDFDFRAATPFAPIPNGSHKLDLVAGADTTNTAPLWTSMLSVLNENRYVLAALGRPGERRLILRQNVRAESASGEAEFFFIHAAPDTGPLDILLRDPAKGNAVVSLIYNNFDFGKTGIYFHLFPGEYNFEVTTAFAPTRVIDVFHFNLSSFSNQPLVFVTSGTGASASEGFAQIGYDQTGTPLLPQITTTALEDDAEVPQAFMLEQNYPNPFNPATQIQYALPQAASVRLAVFDLLGRTVQTLVEAQQPPGSYTVRWDGRNDAGALVPSGIYLYRLEANDVIKTRRMLLVK